MTRGTFISFEGIDGAGKSTHIDGLSAAFRARGRTVTLTREPGGTALAEKLRAIVLNDPMDAMTEALLVFAARRDHLQQLIADLMAKAIVDDLETIQIDEQHAAMVAYAVHPSRKAHLAPNIGGAELGASVTAIDVHREPFGR